MENTKEQEILDREAKVDKWAEVMKQKLREHANKGGWSQENVDYLVHRLREEVDELLQAKTITDANREAADVANFAFMIAENMNK